MYPFYFFYIIAITATNAANVINLLLWLPCVADADIIFLPCGFFLLFFLPRLISAVADWMFTILHTWCGLSANLECRSEMYCTQLSENTGCKNRHFGAIAQFCRAISSELRHVSTIGKTC